MFPKKFWDKIEKDNIPLVVSFELTWRCNQKCLFCYQYPPEEDELTAEEIKDILGQLAAFGTLFIAFTGGEPLLREDFWQIAEYARKKTFALQLQSNGMLIDKTTAKKLKQLNFERIILSLLGACSKTHDYLTATKGSFKKVIKAVEHLKRENLKVELRTTIMQENFSEREDIERLADNLEAEIYFSPVVLPRADGDRTPLKYRVSDEQLKSFYSSIFSKSDKRQISSKIKKKITEPFLLCQFGRTGCAINARGQVNPCGVVPLKLGTLKEDTFSEIWQGSDLLKNIRCATIKDLKECSNCGLSSFCIRCSGLSFLEKGDIFANSDESCRMAKTMKEVILNEKSL